MTAVGRRSLVLVAGSVTRIPQYVALTAAVLGAVVLIGAGYAEHPGNTADWVGYALAADRFMAGDSLYADPSPGTSSLDYRHAPWLAWLWVPLNALPFGALLWQAASLAAACYIIVSLLRLGDWPGMVMAAMALPLLGSIPHANVGTLMVALLMWRRADPISVGIAGSLKIYPLLLCAGYVAERRWRDCAITVGIAGVLWLPALWSGIGDWVPLPGRGIFPSPIPELLLGTGLLLVGWMAYRRSRWTWLGVGALLPVGIPHGVGVQYTWVAARVLDRPSGHTA